MGLEYNKRRVQTPGVVTYSSGYVTLTSTASSLPLNGTATLAGTAAGDHSFKLPTAKAGGRVHVTATDSTHVESVTTATTATTFFGSTFQTVTWSTALGYRMATFEVVGPSSSLKWMVANASTGSVLS